MYGKVYSSCLQGIDGAIIEVEVDIQPGLPNFHIVGLPDSAVRESMERVRAAIKNSDLEFPMRRITVNLAPADMKKEGSFFDLAIAVGILITSNQLKIENIEQSLIIGELSLEGRLRSLTGVLAMVHHAKQQGLTRVFLPTPNLSEARIIQGIDLIPISHLKDLLTSIASEVTMKDLTGINQSQHIVDKPPIIEDYKDIMGQFHAKRAIMISAAGMHNLMLIGPPGSGKTMLARRLPSILPPLSEEEAIEVTKIHSIAHAHKDLRHVISQRPFRSPHHTITLNGLMGGGHIPKPGEITLAHRGVLFLDEFLEYAKPILEGLRQPIEDECVTISRQRQRCTFPAQFMLVASMNPCPCGYHGFESIRRACRCRPYQIQQYRAKLSGPLIDRIDLHVEVPRIEYSEMRQHEMSDMSSMSSSSMRKAVIQAQKIQICRYKAEKSENERKSGIRFNSQLNGKQLHQYCSLKTESEQLMRQSYERLGLSARVHDRILKIARTIADLEGSEHIELAHLAEALQYRCLDRSTDTE